MKTLEEIMNELFGRYVNLINKIHDTENKLLNRL